MSIKTNIAFLIMAFSVIAVFFVFVSDVSANNCVTHLVASMVSAGGSGKPAIATVTNTGNCAGLVTFRSYKEFVARYKPGWLSQQVLFDTQTATIGGGETKQISVNTPGCLTQSDLYYGDGVTSFFSDNPSDYPNILAAAESIDSALCSACTSDCSHDGQRECVAKGWRECRKTADGCFKWGTVTDCESFKTCSNGSCNFNPPAVDLNSSGSVACNKNAILTWISNNADSCSASGAWSGSKTTSGSESVGSFTGSKTFTLTCGNSNASASDSVTLNGSEDNVTANAGSDKTINDDESITLNGSVNGNYDSIRWSCTGGTLSSRTSLRPTFDVNSDNYDSDQTFTCTLTATNECGSDSDSMQVRVNHKETTNFNVSLATRPKNDCAPLNGVDLVAKVTNYGSNDQDYTYYFDCDNDGDWEKTVTSSNTSYTAANLCDYRNAGAYAAKVKVTSNGRTATDTATIRADECRKEIQEVGNVSITKTVRNVTGGTGYLGTVAANPGDTVSYRIILTAVSGNAGNVFLSDAMPNGIINIRDLQIDGHTENDNLASGINIGSLSNGQTKTVTFTATVAGEYNFGWGQTTLTNTATVSVGGKSANSSAAVTVYRHAVQGATTVSTGFAGDMFAGLVVALIGLTACAGWLLKDKILAFFRKDPTESLRKKIALIKAKG